MNKIKPPYNISQLTQEMGLKVIDNSEKYRAEIDQILKEKEKLTRELVELNFVDKVYPSDANFILVKVSDAAVIYDYLATQGIIVRNRSSLPGCDNCLRITVGKKEENALKNYKS